MPVYPGAFSPRIAAYFQRRAKTGNHLLAKVTGSSFEWYNPHMHFAFNWLQGWEDVIKLFVAYFLALPVGWYREREAHSVGVRTFPVVAVASCGYVLLGTPSAHVSLEAQSRIIQGVVAGIGFIGGGAILKSQGGGVHGVAAAASIWNIGVVGAAVAQDRYLLAAALAALNLLTLRLLLPLKARLDGQPPEQPDAAPK